MATYTLFVRLMGFCMSLVLPPDYRFLAESISQFKTPGRIARSFCLVKTRQEIRVCR